MMIFSDSEARIYIMPLMMGGAGLVLLLTLLVGAALVAVCLSQWRRKTSTVTNNPHICLHNTKSQNENYKCTEFVTYLQ